MGHFIRWGYRFLIFIDLYRPTLLRETSSDLERVPSVCERLVFQHLNFFQMTSAGHSIIATAHHRMSQESFGRRAHPMP